MKKNLEKIAQSFNIAVAVAVVVVEASVGFVGYKFEHAAVGVGRAGGFELAAYVRGYGPDIGHQGVDVFKHFAKLNLFCARLIRIFG